MAHYVMFRELYEGNIRDILEYIPGIWQAAPGMGWQINLRDISIYYHFRTKPQTGQKHLHLLHRSILRLIQNDKRLFKGSSAHISQRCHFDDTLLLQFFKFLYAKHVQQSIKQWTEIGVYLFLHISRKESQLFASFHRRAYQNNPLYIPVSKIIGRQCYRQIRFTGSSGPNPKSNGIMTNSIYILFLPKRSRMNNRSVACYVDYVILHLMEFCQSASAKCFQHLVYLSV